MKYILQLIIGNNNRQSIAIENNPQFEELTDIYFTYGDSDVQELLIKGDYKRKENYKRKLQKIHDKYFLFNASI